MKKDGSMKKRLDELLFLRGLCETRSKAKDEILRGKVYVNGVQILKGGKMVEEDAIITIEDKIYVSRGAYKLIKALDEFKITLDGKVCCDIGASTGGFTQVMLERGAKRVYAIDVASGEFRLKDPKIVLMEKTNARFLKKEDFDLLPDFIACDLSFISLKKILPVIREILKEDGMAVCLLKPQFEVGPGRVRDGIVKSKDLHLETIRDILNFANDLNFKVSGLTFSPIKGGSGNIEFLIELNGKDKPFDIERVVEFAWKMEGSQDVHC